MTAELLLYPQLLLVLGADLLLGDPRWPFHPVRLIGRLCETCESLTRSWPAGVPLKIKGAAAWFLVFATSLAFTALIFSVLELWGRTAVLAGAMLLAYFCIAAGDLIRHSKKVYLLLEQDDLTGARQSVGLMVGRDTAALDRAGISRGCVESISENLVDGVTAPLFWAFVCSLAFSAVAVEPLVGAVFGLIGYKSVNTMDSMFGYKNERYREFGWLAARVDDLCNFLPARLTGFCLIGAAGLLGYDWQGAARVFAADRLKSSSPNSGHSEAAAAGSLGIQLGGPASYFGKNSFKPIIGEGLETVNPQHILAANRLITAAALFFFIACCAAHYLVLYLL